MNTARENVEAISDETGFRHEYVQKVLWLLKFLDQLMRHPYLDRKIALKGGTALNVFMYDLPRLSVDIDLNYIGQPEREAMLVDKPRIEKAIESVCQRLGLSVRRRPTEHAGGKWSLKYGAQMPPTGTLELDVNFLFRVPLWPVAVLSSAQMGGERCHDVRVLDIHELASGKLAALFSRSAPRDIFDSVLLLKDGRIDYARLRLGFITYGAMSRHDWRTIRIEDIRTSEDSFNREVTLLLRSGSRREGLAEAILAECRALAAQRLLPLRDNEMEFLRLVNEQGIIQPELLTGDVEMQKRIRAHPALEWKALNVRQHRGLPEV